MRNLIRRMFPVVASIWMLTFLKCSTMPVTLQGYHLKSTQDGGQLNIIKRLEENRVRAISLEKRWISQSKIQGKDTSFYQRCKMLDSIDLELQKHSFTLIPMARIMMDTKSPMSFGYISNTVGNTLCLNYYLDY